MWMNTDFEGCYSFDNKSRFSKGENQSSLHTLIAIDGNVCVSIDAADIMFYC